MSARRRISVFLKLLGIYSVTLAIIGAGYAAIRLLGVTEDKLDVPLSAAERYLGLVVGEIGNPPDLDRARRIADETGFGIAIRGPALAWDSATDSRARDARAADARVSSFAADRADDREFVFTDGPYEYRITAYVEDRLGPILVLSTLFAVSVLALAANYAMVRKVLAPLADIDRVAREFGVSEWKLRVRARGNDEFASLAGTMDAMADRIESYVRSSRDLLRAVSHEYRSPLARMRVAVGLLDDRRVARILEREIALLDRMTGLLLERERLAAGSASLAAEPVVLEAWLASVCEPYRAAGSPVSYRYRGEPLTAMIDPRKTEMALRNLVDNALKHAPGTPVEIELRVPGDGSTQFELEVADGGPGMEDDEIERIGEPFFVRDASRTGSRESGGFGLGLSVVKAVADAHGATFAVRNASPHGLRATIAFPFRERIILEERT